MEVGIVIELIIETVCVFFDMVLDSILNPVFDKLGQLFSKFKEEP